MPLTPVKIPKLGMYVEGIRLAHWLVDEGAPVALGEPLFEVETDKASQEIEAEAAGWVHRHVVPGGDVEVGQVIGTIAASEEAYRMARDAGVPPSEPAAPPQVTAPPGSFAVEGPVPPEPASAHEVAVAPRARRLLAEHGIGAAEVIERVGIPAGGRLTDRDVAKYIDGSTPASAGTHVPDDGMTVATRIPLRGRRGLIAARMVDSLRIAPQLTSVLEIDASAALAQRERGAGVRHVTVFVAAVAQALRGNPALNAVVIDDEIRLIEEINVAVAVETDDGVVAPVVRAADRLAIDELDARIGELVVRARERRSTPDDLGGATFTVSSSGANPVDLTTAILNPPQVGILWLGRIRLRALVRDGAVVAAPTLQACLTYDHRAIDGAPAAAFLGAFARALESGAP
jgi:pyruvate/2-oxoglutarate dehydrogenase complex dihydrolipoamide acyltransferase (E2) component